MAALTLAAAGICTTVWHFWNLPGAFLSGVAAASGIAFINASGSISGFVAPPLVGFVKDTTGSTNNAVLAIAACVTLASLLVFVIPARLVNK